MADSKSAAHAFDEYAKGLDFLSFHSPNDILAPHPDLFEADLESSLAALHTVNLQLLTVDSNDAYSFLRDDSQPCGPPSTITVSSESAYDSLSSYSESFYGYPTSSYSFPLEMEFQNIRVDSDYGATVDPISFGPLPPTPPRSPEMPPSPAKSFDIRSSFSDYSPATYQNQVAFNSTVAPSATAIPPVEHDADSDVKPDARRKYRCNTCPRAFARAYNLKTHMATHDPNRLKPHVCPHRSCGRAFSRKHDLARHQVSLHGAQKPAPAADSYRKIGVGVGVDKAHRGWCDKCGRGWVGRAGICACEPANVNT